MKHKKETEGKKAGWVCRGIAQEIVCRPDRPLRRSFSPDNLENTRRFYMTYKTAKISETPSRKLSKKKSETVSRKSKTPSAGLTVQAISERFPLPWSAYVRLLSLKGKQARTFYEQEALRGGWSVRQLDRQINSQFYERTALSKNKAAMLTRGAKPKPQDAVTPEEQIKDPYVLEFLSLKDEYSESLNIFKTIV